jgi:hypothetical protein
VEPELVLAVVLLACVPVGLGALTASGSRRRGAGRLTAVVSGLFFPVTWVVWHVRDTRRPGGREAAAGG